MAAVEKHYPRDERAELDVGADFAARPPKPCCRRLHFYVNATWCHLEDNHAGDCEGPEPRALELNTFMPRRKR